MAISLPSLTHRYFQPDQLGMLISYPHGLGTSWQPHLQDFLDVINAELDPVGVRLHVAAVRSFPRWPMDRTKPAKHHDKERNPLDDPFLVVFADVEGTNGDTTALIELVQGLERLDLRELAPGLTMTKEAVVLNWLTGAGANVPIGTGGPGNEPVAYVGNAAQLASLASNPPPFEDLQPLGNAGKGVDVYILDTAWPEQFLDTAIGAFGQDCPSVLRQLRDPANPLMVQEMDDIDRVRLSHIFIQGHDYSMRDHGTFIAGIIRTIAPNARLTLVEVLSEFGIGDLQTIVGALEKIALEPPVRPTFINCSLMMNIPYDQLHTWNQEMRDRYGPKMTTGFLLSQAATFQLICDQLTGQGYQIVAAAGNEGPVHAPARYPAAFDSVAGVGAARRMGKPKENDENRRTLDAVADYSNQSDFPGFAGTVTLGGGENPGSDDPPLLGLYLGNKPRTDERNPTGWAWWSGTSFATPIVTGRLAAQVAAMPPNSRATDTLESARNHDPRNGPQPGPNDPVERGRVMRRATKQDEGFLWTRQVLP